MRLRICLLPLLTAAFSVLLWLPVTAGAQQVVQRGAFGTPTGILDETGQWTTPLLLVHDKDVEIYIPDVSSRDWLKMNYPEYWDKYQYELTFLTFYRTPRACRANMIGWGNSDAAHLNACENDIGYRIRRATVDTHLKTVTLVMAAMVDHSGQIVPSTEEDGPISRNWADLDSNTQQALEKASGLVDEQMKSYNRRLNNSH
jgi:hypothetical protein